MLIISIKYFLRKIYNIILFRHIFSYLYSLVVKPPYKYNDMELRYGLWAGVSSLHCANGRQFGESNLKPEILQDLTMQTQLHKCKFDGARFGFLMNKSSLDIVIKDWDAALNIIVSIRQLYLDKKNQSDKTLTLLDCYMVSKMCVALPAYMVRKFNSNIKNGDISDVVCSQYQLISGIFMIVRKMIEQGESFLTPDALLTANDIYGYADTHNVFFSERNNQVCSGSKVKILELIELVLNGDAQKKRHKYEFISPYINDIDVFYEYSIASIEIELIVALSRASSQRYLYNLIDIRHKNNDLTDKQYLILLKNIEGLNYKKKYFLVILNTRINLYVIFLTKYMNCRNKIEILKIVNINEDSIDYEKDELSDIFGSYSKFIEISLNYLRLQQAEINAYLGDKKNTILKNKEIYSLVNVMSKSICFQHLL